MCWILFLFWKIEHQPSSKNFSQHRKIFVSRKLKKQYQVKSQKNKYKWMKLKKIKIKGLKFKKKRTWTFHWPCKSILEFGKIKRGWTFLWPPNSIPKAIIILNQINCFLFCKIEIHSSDKTFPQLLETPIHIHRK
jgi:hypothetical protein